MTEEVCKHEEKQHSERHDAYFCRKCGEWLESKCKDPDCEFCKDRPERSKDG